jgi:hypothetical protein
MLGAVGLDGRINQLTLNKITTTTFEKPWSNPFSTLNIHW